MTRLDPLFLRRLGLVALILGLVLVGWTVWRSHRVTPRPELRARDLVVTSLEEAGYHVLVVPHEDGVSMPQPGTYFARDSDALARLPRLPRGGRPADWVGCGVVLARRPLEMDEPGWLVGPDYEIYGDPRELTEVKRVLGLR